MVIVTVYRNPKMNNSKGMTKIQFLSASCCFKDIEGKLHAASKAKNFSMH